MVNKQAKNELTRSLERIESHERAEQHLSDPEVLKLFSDGRAKLDYEWGKGADSVGHHQAKELIRQQIEARWDDIIQSAKVQAQAIIREQTGQAKKWAEKL